MDLYQLAKRSAEKWLNEPAVDEDSKSAIRAMLADPNHKPLIDSFYQNLEFGTGGLRGVMGVGSNCINRYTIGAATQGLAHYLKKYFPDKKTKVCIAYDSRNNSREFAQITAGVFAGNDIEVYLFAELRPTPLLSFAVRYLQCQSGIVITASHNPKEYNGYKAYWADGAQLVSPHDQKVIEEVNRITSFDQVRFNGNPDNIHPVPAEVENAYYQEVGRLIPARESISRQHNIPIVFSSIHGTGNTMVPECLARIGFSNCILVEAQSKPDGNFPTVASPNPEEHAAMKMALDLAQASHAELVMATDPDADRVGIGIKDDQGQFFLLNGNQAFALMIWFILSNLTKKKGQYIAKTIVTTELVDAMASKMGVECINTLTGFKYIAGLIKKYEQEKTFLAAGEESYGYMVGDFVRDKDAVSACAFFAAMAATARDKGETLFDWLQNIYMAYGFYKEGLINLVRKGADGAMEIKKMMHKFRNDPPTSINGERVSRVLDYKSSLETDTASGKTKPINLPSSDVLQFYTESGTKVSVRPSGTEPKIKFYISTKATLNSKKEYSQIDTQLNEKIKSIANELIG